MPIQSFLFLALIAGAANAQAPATGGTGSGAAVSGVVRDSISQKPLADATVQLVDADSLPRFGRIAVSDSLGRFTIPDVPDGRYTLGFFHPMLDSLGVEAPLRAVEVVGQRPVRADLAVPSPARLRAAICGPQSAAESGALVVGVVRDARDRAPVSGATVVGQWLELTYMSRTVSRQTPRLVAKTGENGWFAMCGVPSAGTIALTAHRGSDSTDLIEVEVPPQQFVRRDLYIGPARTVAIGDSAQRADTSVQPPRVHTGDGRLSGTVVTVAEGRPLPGAQVGITAGPRTRANELGEWTVLDAPIGTRMLEVRAVGYYPVRRAVDIVGGVPPVHVALFTLGAVLDTVKVTAARLLHRLPTGFDDRRRSGAGSYITPADVAKHRPIVASDLFRFVPGIRTENVGPLDKRFVMHGAFANRCSPEVYINSHYMDHIGPDEVDSWVRPNEIEGIEIYSEASVPAQFHRSMGDCGAIVIWAKGW